MRATPAAAPPAPADGALELLVAPPPGRTPGFDKALDKARTATAEGHRHNDKHKDVRASKDARPDETPADPAALGLATPAATQPSMRDAATTDDADTTAPGDTGDQTTSSSQTSEATPGPAELSMTDEPAPVEGRQPAVPSVLPTGVGTVPTPVTTTPAGGDQAANGGIPAESTPAPDPKAGTVPSQEVPSFEGVAPDAVKVDGTPGQGDAHRATPATPPAHDHARGEGATPAVPAHKAGDAASGPSSVASAPQGPLAASQGAAGASGGAETATAATQATAQAPTPPAAALPPTAAPTAPTRPAVMPTPTPAVELAATIEKLHDVIHLSSARGGARAHLELHPRDLGAVDVRLRTTQDGVIATIRVHEPAALAAVSGAGAELRDSLQQRGITVARLDVSLAGGDGRSPGESRGDQPRNGRARGAGGVLGTTEDDTTTVTTTSTTTGVTSSLVDVKA